MGAPGGDTSDGRIARWRALPWRVVVGIGGYAGVQPLGRLAAGMEEGWFQHSLYLTYYL